MNKINLLDCTLRDGGYINNWKFGFRTIQSILEKLVLSGVEYVECGYLSEKKGGNEDFTQYRSFDAIRRVKPQGNGKQQFAVMIDYGQYDIAHIPQAETDSPIIRVCFHKKDKDGALDYCKQLMEKGYSVFVQPMASLNYTDVEFVEIIQRVNELSPACFYIVDSFGVIEIENFQRILFLADHNLRDGIILGYHAHNNLQQAYGNAKYMVEQRLLHDIMLDASVYGMGRGAGNLNMELFASYLNKNYDKFYNIDAFLDIMDEHLKPIFAEHYWGYSLPFYLSAQYNCHPNYAGYFADKNTLSNKSMRLLLASLPADVKNHYSAELAEEYYQSFQKKYVDDSETLDELKAKIGDNKILILAPGKSLIDHQDSIQDYISDNQPVVIAINVAEEQFRCDYLFCASEKRLKGLIVPDGCKLIVSSNIDQEIDALRINYASYLGTEDLVADNPALMVIRILIAIGVKGIAVAGLDGYSASAEDNYYDPRLALGTSISIKMQKNVLIRKELKLLESHMDIMFLTPSKYCEQ
ncbi:aldolase catalytic domain-containing protein [Butyrivibrio sp. YAB3001]|uniref:aldolase catalytic domain-containing protein n=1 Tax=Butyrivibrio sp. YAB3001 TaxID=1520812 RepID=UPI0008F68571|nr:aldolase catalytic domain-containing protein [Butyrivibrio sp. YAB3001]SFC87448.1 4-hydroxy 2-oxovalerate aldolase [Butyrivibrio sp. YAB3001]